MSGQKNTNKPAEGELIAAIHEWDTALIKELLERGADPLERDIAGHSAIAIAIWYNQPEIIELLKDARLERLHRKEHDTPPTPLTEDGKPAPSDEQTKTVTEKHLESLRQKRTGKSKALKNKPKFN